MQPPARPTSDPDVVSLIRTETPCAECHYILHFQQVRRDPGTGLLVVRCPECGRTHAAEGLSLRLTRWRRWLGRRRRGQILLAIVLSLLTIGPCIAMTKIMTEFDADNLDTLVPAVILSWIYGLILLRMVSMIYSRHVLLRMVICLLGPALTMKFTGEDMMTSRFAMSVTIGQLVLAMLIAVVCRPILRTLLRILLPNASRYVFEDLWQVDGKLVDEGPW